MVEILPPNTQYTRNQKDMSIDSVSVRSHGLPFPAYTGWVVFKRNARSNIMIMINIYMDKVVQ